MLFDGFEAAGSLDVDYDVYKQHEAIRHGWMVEKKDYLNYLRGCDQWKSLRRVAKLITVRTQSDKTTVISYRAYPWMLTTSCKEFVTCEQRVCAVRMNDEG